MGFLNITKLQPGRSYSVVVRARDDNGFISENSLIYNFTVPSKNSDGTQLTAINSAVVTALAPDSSSVTGGALIAGGLDATGVANSGAINLGSVWNNTASSIAKLTGAANTGAVIINSTGILGYQLTSTSSGQANFFLDTASGNAYFRGTIFANAGQIGGFGIDSTSLSASTFFNKLTSFDPSFEDNWLNYWSASADYFGSLDMGLSLQNDATINPIQAGLKYAKFSVYAFGNGSPNITGSSMEMTMFRTASSKTAFSQSDLGISSGNTYTFSIYAQDLGSDQYGTPAPAQLFLKINKYSSASTSSATFISSTISTAITTSSTSWTRISASFTTSSAEYYTFSIVNAQDYQASPPGAGRYVDATFAVDAIQLNAGNTAGTFGFDNYFSVSPADSKPINLSSISNTGSTSNIFSVYTDGGVFANYFFSNKQSKIGSIYFGGRKSSNISIGDYFATNQDNTNGNNINIGNMSLGAHISGSNNIAIGYNAAGYVGYGSNNVVIGGYTGDLYWTNNNVVIADGSGSVRFRSDSTGSVTITGSVTATAFIGDGSRLTGIGGSSSVAYATNAGSATYASSAGFLPISGLSASTITIGSTSIGLGGTSTNLAGLTNFGLTNTTDSTTIFSISGQSSNSVGGGLSLTTSANGSGVAGTASGGNIVIRTTATQSGATATARGGNISINTDGSSGGAGGTNGGNISITTTKGTIYDSSGSITLSSGGKFSISADGANTGTIDNFNIGVTTPGTGNFISLTISGSSVATQAYSNSASLNAYNSAVTYANSASLNAYNSASAYTQSSSWNNTSASVRYASSAGFLPTSGLSASTITIGSTSIGLGGTSTTLSGLTTFDLANTTSSAIIFSASSQASNTTGGRINLSTDATATGVAGTATSGAINISTNASQSGATAGATGGAINISTNAAGPGAGGANGGNITITTTKSGTYGVAGNINLTSNANFTISTAAGYTGTIDNFNIGATTAGTGRFTSLTVTSSSIRMGTNTLNIYDNSASTRINFASSGEVLLGRQNTSNEGGNLQLANALDNAAGWNIDSYGTTASPDLRFFINGNVKLTLNGVSGNATFTNAVSAQSFSGDGSGLTNLPSGNPTYAQVLTSTTTSTSGSSLFAVFPAGSSNFNLKANTVYYFEGAYLITKAATATNANWTFGLVFSQTQQNLYYTITGTSNSATAATLQASTNSQSTSLNIGTAGLTSAGLVTRFQGFFVTNATNGGTLTPSFGQSVTPSSGSPTVSTGAYFRLTEYGSSFPVVSGSWT